MKIGFLVPSESEMLGIPQGVASAANFGPGKAAGCAAVADLVFRQGCDTVIIWGAAGGYSPEAQVGDIYVVDKAAYSDFDLTALIGGEIGIVPDYADKDQFVDMNPIIVKALKSALERLLPGQNIKTGSIGTGDRFVHHASPAEYNCVEKRCDMVDMELAAAVHFVHLLNTKSGMNIRLGCMRMISDNANHSAPDSFVTACRLLHKLNTRLEEMEGFLTEELTKLGQ